MDCHRLRELLDYDPETGALLWRHDRRDNATGVTGVTLRRGRWVAQMRHRGRQHHLGQFDTLEQAAQCYEEASRRRSHFDELAKYAGIDNPLAS